VTSIYHNSKRGSNRQLRQHWDGSNLKSPDLNPAAILIYHIDYRTGPSETLKDLVRPWGPRNWIGNIRQEQTERIKIMGTFSCAHKIIRRQEEEEESRESTGTGSDMGTAVAQCCATKACACASDASASGLAKLDTWRE